MDKNNIDNRIKLKKKQIRFSDYPGKILQINKRKLTRNQQT